MDKGDMGYGIPPPLHLIYTAIKYLSVLETFKM